MSTLAELRDLVESDLDDSSNDTWATGEIDRAIQRALNDYSYVNPQEIVGTINLAADGREISLSTLSGLTKVVRVWYPYTSTDPEDPPEWRRFEVWATTLYILDGDEPDSGEVVRVYYNKAQTINGLAGASSTTLPALDEELIVLGAGAYAAIEKARSAVAAAGVSTETPEQWLAWGTHRMDAFVKALRELQARNARRLDKRVPLQRDAWARNDTREEI